MENREVLQSIMAAFQKKAPVLLAEKKAERAKIGILDNGLFVYYFEGEQVCKGCSAAKTPDGRTIDTRRAEMVSWEIFLHKRDPVHSELPPAQILQNTGVGLEVKAQIAAV